MVDKPITDDTNTTYAPGRFDSPTTLDKPAFLMNVPFSLATAVPNNPWMRDMGAEERRVELGRATCQFLQLYHFMAAEAVVYLLPTPKLAGLQDLVYCANMGIVLEHMSGANTVVLSNFSTEVRVPETAVGRAFFESMGYVVTTSPYHFEGEAELKHLHDKVYLGGYGTRSDRRSYEWMAESFDMRIVPL